MSMRVGDLVIGQDRPLVLIAGPCQLESLDHARMVCEGVLRAADGMGVIFKASYDKANRTSGAAARGAGMGPGPEILARIRDEFGVPVLARAAVAAVFIETHQDPDRAPSDGPNMVPLADLPALMARLRAFDRLAKGL